MMWQKIGYNIHEYAIKKKMITIAICDSKEQDRKHVAGFCEDYLKNKIASYEIKEYASGESLLAEVFPDVLFLNTNIKRIDGILVKDILYKLQAETKIIFISREQKRMADAFGRNVYGFLKKPIQQGALSERLQNMINDIIDEENSMFCKRQKEVRKVLFRDIVCIKAYGRYTKLFVRGEEEYQLSDKSFCDWYLEMEEREFICCHRSYLVNLYYIEDIDVEISLINGMRIPIARDRRNEFFESYRRYIRSRKNGIENG